MKAMISHGLINFHNNILFEWVLLFNYNDVIFGAMESQIISLTIVYLTVYSGAYQRRHQSSASLAFVRGMHRWPVNSPHKWRVTRKCFNLMTLSCSSNNMSRNWSNHGILTISLHTATALMVPYPWILSIALATREPINHFVCRPHALDFTMAALKTLTTTELTWDEVNHVQVGIIPNAEDD